MVVLDASGNVYVADTGDARVRKLSPAGCWLAAWGSRGRGPGQLWSPTVVAVDRAGHLGALHLRLYQQRFAHRIGNAKLPALSVDGPGEDGLGVAHLPVTPRLFAAWRPWFVKAPSKRPVPSDAELRPYRARQQERAGVRDLDVTVGGG